MATHMRLQLETDQRSAPNPLAANRYPRTAASDTARGPLAVMRAWGAAAKLPLVTQLQSKGIVMTHSSEKGNDRS